MKVRKINENLYRIGNYFPFVDIILIENDIIRMGTMPDISKTLIENNWFGNIVYLFPGNISVTGDNLTGEEFIMWNCIFKYKTEITYFQKERFLNNFFEKLKLTISGDFNERGTKIVNRRWLKKYFKRNVLLDGEAHHKRYCFVQTGKQIKLFYKDDLIYKQSLEFSKLCDKEYKSIISRTRKVDSDNRVVRHPQILILGSGNGFVGDTSSFLIRTNDFNMAIDAPANFASKLIENNIHPDWVNSIIITHNHEDHYSGLAGLIEFKRKRNRKLNIITRRDIFITLRKQLYYIKDFMKLVKFVPVETKKEYNLFDMSIVFRLNHHVLKYGTLGLKVKLNGHWVGISGDTCYKERFATKFNNSDLSYKWFRECDVVFHEMALPSRHSVHTFPHDIDYLKNRLKAKFYVYHIDKSPSYPLLIAGQKFIFKKESIDLPKKQRKERKNK